MLIQGDIETIERKLGELRSEHRSLDKTISQLWSQGYPDDMEIAALKRRKLQLKDSISDLEREIRRRYDA